MENIVQVAYEILSFLEAPSEYNSRENLNAENLQISEDEFKHILWLMQDEGVIASAEGPEGIELNQDYINSIQITEKGKEYLKTHYLDPETGAQIEISSNGFTSSCIIDGKDYSMEVSEIVYRHEAEKLPTLEITFSNINNLKIRSVVGSVIRKKAASTSDTADKC